MSAQQENPPEWAVVAAMKIWKRFGPHIIDSRKVVEMAWLIASAHPSPDEVNPGHAVTAGLRGQWHKLLGIVMWKTGQLQHVVTAGDLDGFSRAFDGDMPAVVAREDPNGLTISLLTISEAEELAKKDGG